MSTSDSITPLKKCTKCGEEKPATREYFTCGKKHDILGAVCKACAAKKMREYRKKNPDADKKAQKRWRTKNRGHLREYQRKFYATHCTAYREYQRRWRFEHRETVRASAVISSRKWREANKEIHRHRERELYQINRVKRLASAKKWRMANKNQRRIQWNKRRILKFNADGFQRIS